MITSKEVREDLKTIKYYYARKKVIDAEFENAEENRFKELAKKYNDIAKKGPAKMYDLFVLLYKKNYTQESFSNAMCYAKNYVYQLNRKLIEFIVNELNKGEKENESNAWFY